VSFWLVPFVVLVVSAKSRPKDGDMKRNHHRVQAAREQAMICYGNVKRG
jgi:hypothetical protein